MPGALIQLANQGDQGARLTIKPQVSFFRSVYRRHTNFAMESVEQTLLGTVGFGNKVSVIFSRTGDLVGRVLLEVKIPYIEYDGQLNYEYSENAHLKSGGYVNYLGHRLIKEVSVEIGGQLIDRRNYRFNWLIDEIDDELRGSFPNQVDKSTWVGNVKGYVSPGVYKDVGHRFLNHNAGNRRTNNLFVRNSPEMLRTLYIPIKFWFSSGDMGQTIPLIALQYHDVKLNITFESFDKVTHFTEELNNPGADNFRVTFPAAYYDAGTYKASGTYPRPKHDLSCKVYTDYYFLDTSERRRFAQMSHEYLIEQAQLSNVDTFIGCHKDLNLKLTHGVKELFWTINVDCPPTERHWWKGLPVKEASLALNNKAICDSRVGKFFTHYTFWKHHNKVPLYQKLKNIHCFSFSEKPEQFQPTNACNFSRLDSATLSVTMKTPPSGSNPYLIHVFAKSYNVLRISQGMGGVAFSN